MGVGVTLFSPFTLKLQPIRARFTSRASSAGSSAPQARLDESEMTEDGDKSDYFDGDKSDGDQICSSILSPVRLPEGSQARCTTNGQQRHARKKKVHRGAKTHLSTDSRTTRAFTNCGFSRLGSTHAYAMDSRS
jgi:hypothetical protein